MGKSVSAVSLSDKQREELRTRARSARTWKEFCRARAIALRAADWPVAQIAEAFDVTPQTVYGWIGRFQQHGPDGLQEASRSGRPRLFGDGVRRQIRETVRKRPTQFGLAFTVWTVLTLAAQIFRWTRQRISPSHLRRVLRDEGFVWRRPKLSLRRRQNRKLYKAVQRRLERLEKDVLQGGSNFVLVYQDEAEFHLNPGLTGMWMPKGEQTEIPSAGQNRKAAAFAAIDWATGRMVWHLAGRKNQTEFLQFLQKLRAAFPRKRLVVVLDNVAYHKTKAVHQFVTDAGGQIELLWLPPYSPNLNRIERVWKHLKKTYVYNEFFGDEAGLLRAVEGAFQILNSDLALARGLTVNKPRRKKAA